MKIIVAGSRGTKNMIEEAGKEGLKIRIIKIFKKSVDTLIEKVYN